jgi:hypothetical protein
VEAKEIEAAVGDLETSVDRLRGLYEQYFMGIERIAPAVVHKEVERRLYALRKEQIRNTAVRFRFQMILQRYNTYQTHWQRICRQIEEGTYKRDVMRAQRRMGAAPSQAPKPTAAAEEPVAIPHDPVPEMPDAPKRLLEDDLVPPSSMKPLSQPPPLTFQKLELDDLDAFGNLDLSAAMKPPTSNRPAAPATRPPVPRSAAPVPPVSPAKTAAPPVPPAGQKPQPPPLPPKKPPPPVPAQTQGLSDARIKQIYAQYVETRQSQQEKTTPLSYDALAKSLKESSARLKEKHGNVDFEVAVKEGKTILRAVVKKPK